MQTDAANQYKIAAHSGRPPDGEEEEEIPANGQRHLISVFTIPFSLCIKVT